MKSSSVIIASLGDSAVGNGVDKVFNIRTVSGMREDKMSIGIIPFNKFRAAGVSPLRPIKVAKGPEPNGVLTAWLY